MVRGALVGRLVLDSVKLFIAILMLVLVVNLLDNVHAASLMYDNLNDIPYATLLEIVIRPSSCQPKNRTALLFCF